MRQIHADIDTSFWENLVSMTDEWPEANRTQSGICQYALSELISDMMEPDFTMPEPAPRGDRHVQVRVVDAYTENRWATLAATFGGSYVNMLRTALAKLSNDLSMDITE